MEYDSRIISYESSVNRMRALNCKAETKTHRKVRGEPDAVGFCLLCFQDEIHLFTNGKKWYIF